MQLIRPFMCGPAMLPLSAHLLYTDLCLVLLMHEVSFHHRTFIHAFLPEWYVFPFSPFLEIT